jgi:hypothetical protein
MRLLPNTAFATLLLEGIVVITTIAASALAANNPSAGCIPRAQVAQGEGGPKSAGLAQGEGGPMI